jgi:AraC family transcriptional regulator of adaptative response / DNA-3-methyladenine glycosylase II
MSPLPDTEARYRAIESRDPRFDGWFVLGVTSTRIYCRPSCPAMTPKRENVRFYPTAAAARRAGFRACLRCRPDAAPGSPEWRSRSDVVARAMRLIGDGLVEREGVGGLAARLGYSERHLGRLLTAELGAGPLALALARRAEVARTLIETISLPFSEIAFAAGFSSIRQFNDAVRAAFGGSPSWLRARANGARPVGAGALTLRLAVRRPFDAAPLLRFLGARAVAGVERADDTSGGPPAYVRALRLPHGAGVVELAQGDGHVACTLRLDDLRDLAAAVARCRRLLDLDADPAAVDAVLGRDPALAPLVAARPGLRVAGSPDGFETAVRAVVGQRISVAGARTLLGRMAAANGEPLEAGEPGIERLFPSPDAIARAPDDALPGPAAKRRALRALAEAVAGGGLRLDPGADPDETRRALVALPGIGPWTASYVAMRALSDPDAFLPTDLGARRGAQRLGLLAQPAALTARAEAWRPWRAYALAHLWSALDPPISRTG